MRCLFKSYYRRTSLVGVQNLCWFFLHCFSWLYPVILPLLETNLSEWLNIQNRETPSSGPSLINSWPSPFPHFPQRTCKYQQHTIKYRVIVAPRAPAPPWRLWESPSSCWHCPLWWFLWTLAKEKSGGTWSDWRTVGGCTGSTHKHLSNQCQKTFIITCKEYGMFCLSLSVILK